ncbi:MAG TPA: adenylate/guanylate cyclase domain-containing protein [Nocardioidaceae bacterium]|nr:adenylate/guanylate cyclase domain-containing protein [Nocardioidaceae bacterium]
MTQPELDGHEDRDGADAGRSGDPAAPSVEDEWSYVPPPEPPAALGGLRFLRSDDERAYQRWRAHHVRPFMKFSMYAATSAAVIAWIAVAAGALIEYRVLALVLIALEIGFLLVGAAVAPAPGRRDWLTLCCWMANLIGGFLAVLLTLPLQDIAVTSSCVTLAAYFALALYRMKPLVALSAVLPYVVFGMVIAVKWRVEGVIETHLMVIGIFVLLTVVVTGLVVNLAVEWLTRRTYLDHLVIDAQQAALYEERTSMARFLSPEVSKAIHDRGLTAAIKTEMVSLTAVSIDLRGFTAYTRINGAEQMAVVLRDFYAAVVEAARVYGATVKDFAGDGAMVLVGAPIRRPDHTRVGLELGREMLWKVREVALFHSGPGTVLGAGVGIASGECAVGPIGSITQVEYTAVGSAVNISARLCDLAKDGEILMAASTARALEECPGWRRAVMELQGFAEPFEITIEDTCSGEAAPRLALVETDLDEEDEAVAGGA